VAVVEQVSHDRRGSGLTVRAGDAKEAKTSRRLCIGDGGDKGRCAPTLAYGERRQIGSRWVFDDRESCAALCGGIKIIVPIAVPATDGDECISGGDFAAVVRNPV